ncbi:MAG: PaaX family transcriptional regulator [Acidimicrobiales bacterium]
MTTVTAGATDREEAGGVDLPRVQGGAQPQHLLTTLLGDYWGTNREHLPSAALVRLLAEFGVTSTGARAALSRLSRRGLLESSKVGRRTYYGLTSRAAEVLAEGTRRILSFGRSNRPWGGRWTVVAFSLPEEQRDLRHTLRTRLRWLGFAPLYDGMWVSPREDDDEVVLVLAELGVGTATVMSAVVTSGSPVVGNPGSAWDLKGLRRTYAGFIAGYTPLRDRVRSGVVGASEALVARTEVMDSWRNFPNLDPELPDTLLPPHWPRLAAREIFVEVYDGLAPLAEARFRQVLAAQAPGLAHLAHSHTSRLLG